MLWTLLSLQSSQGEAAVQIYFSQLSQLVRFCLYAAIQSAV